MKGYTRTSALGPISDFVETRGGSIDRVFRNVDLPLALLENTELPLPLSEQFNVLSQAGREIGDPFFGASLGRHVSMNKLSAFGAWVGGAPTLAGAIDRSARGLNRFLQTATVLRFEVSGECASWSIEFLDPGSDGRFQNELLGVSYLIDGVRIFAGGDWSPRAIRSTCVGPEQAAKLENVFEAPVTHDAAVSAVEFDVPLLTATGLRRESPDFATEPPIPNSIGCREDVAALSAIALLERYPKIDWVARKLDMSRRTLQRTLDAEGCSFSTVLEGLLKDRAMVLIRSTKLSLTEIALQLGYSDVAHFSRAFRRWVGTPPSRYRAQFS
ncbi:AraC family transcriptional regulator ligand-binding domain-containing protein [Ruegeria sp. 2205SS24-7]|uniref:helix-turn-helix domain-containing protein n=1 Tax=Ruegeria discodermiae TaxID=3064389 RepID=UPI002740A584|nr:AraC family transcriptional regulator [Ruegeria sp. 2205SS24-7]MDP5218562.1 AraC family transcriptional regulator ligand-binding domain-containing protein [Ruegeria sp. 2205SS24-7]